MGDRTLQIVGRVSIVLLAFAVWHLATRVLVHVIFSITKDNKLSQGSSLLSVPKEVDGTGWYLAHIYSLIFVVTTVAFIFLYVLIFQLLLSGMGNVLTSERRAQQHQVAPVSMLQISSYPTSGTGKKQSLSHAH